MGKGQRIMSPSQERKEFLGGEMDYHLKYYRKSRREHEKQFSHLFWGQKDWAVDSLAFLDKVTL